MQNITKLCAYISNNVLYLHRYSQSPNKFGTNISKNITKRARWKRLNSQSFGKVLM